MPRTAAPAPVPTPAAPDAPPLGLAARLLLDRLQDRAAPDGLLADVQIGSGRCRKNSSSLGPWPTLNWPTSPAAEKPPPCSA